MKVSPIIRGCGKRVKGGLYACCATSPYGEPIEHFLIDPPTPYNGEPFRAPTVEGSDLIFWVGKEYYPYCPDFIEETRLYGISKRIPLGGINLEQFLPFKTRMFFVHPRAVVDVMEPVIKCPKGKAEHLEGKDRCINALYYFIKKADLSPSENGYSRTIGSVTYNIPKIIDGAVDYSAGIFVYMPLTHFEYVMPDNKKVDKRVEMAIEKGANVVCVEED